MMWVKKIVYNPLWLLVIGVFTIFTFFGITGGDILNKLMDYEWIISAAKWSLIFGAILFAIHSYIRAEKNRKQLINIKTSAYDEAYKHFTNKLSYAIGRYKGYSSNLAPEKEKYTEIGVLEQINEVKSARLQLLSVCGKHVRSVLSGAGDEWLNDIHSFGREAPLIMQKLSKTAFKDRI